MTASNLFRSEDWWAVWFGFFLLGLAIIGIIVGIPKPAKWTTNPFDAFPSPTLWATVALWMGLALLTTAGIRVTGESAWPFLVGFSVVFVLALLAKLAASQTTVKDLGLGYALWSLAFGLLIANTVRTPRWLLVGARSELFIKTGLVLLGAEILIQKIVALGGPGLFVAWLVTPVVVIFMWLFGTRVLNMASKSLVMVIACATSVCGVSAAIASAAACKAKKEELSLAVGMTMIFTVGMMVGMPALSRVLGFDQLVGGAWIGGTVDSTGAVVAAGALLGDQAEKVAAVVKLIQNVLIGLIAFIIAVYWVSVVERDSAASRPSAMEIWHRFPKFIVGFLGASLFFFPGIGSSHGSRGSQGHSLSHKRTSRLVVRSGVCGHWPGIQFQTIDFSTRGRKADFTLYHWPIL